MFNVKVNFNYSTVAKKVDGAFGFGQYVLDNAVIKDSNYYVPTDEHHLERSALLHSKVGKGELVWETPYARKLYYNPQYTFSKDKNPNAQGLWYEVAKAEKRDDWIDQANKATKSKL
ncbi:minor capsid protein [Oceanobacillus sp. CF4.6]|uniref:minor capsid protein n=1 Tax=Oceanobacillus sp. CF4.6 TaxID=3373080 RepID=UPI003EE763A9